MSKECHLCTLRDNVIFETKEWVVVLNIDQNYLGRYLVISKRHADSLSTLNHAEWVELKGVIEKSESLLRRTFPQITLFNWACLMNHAFREKPYNPHVHWHVKPRHDDPISFGGVTWTDNEFGSHYNPKSKNIVPEETLRALLTHIRKHL
jgi:diadenosine tetraphosphate (Ap4A) HIT family hydrolase